MFRTFLLLPHDFLGVPLLGVGWAVLLLAVYIVVRLAAASRQPGGLGSTIREEGVLWVVAAGLLIFLGPRLELAGLDGQPVGMAIRGYGVFLAVAVASAVALAGHRAATSGLTTAPIMRIAPYAVVGGLVGARLFFVLQYRETFIRETWWETIKAAAAITEGGLVVYGGFIGGFLAALFAARRMSLPVWKLGDVIVPSLFIGLMFGRLGCLMNGCCYGGPCEPGPLAIRFPPGSPVYYDQMLSGRLIGVDAPVTDGKSGELGRNELTATAVRPDSIAKRRGVEAGDRLVVAIDRSTATTPPPGRPAEESVPGLVLLGNDQGKIIRLPPAELPAAAMPVVATQIISSVLAAIAVAGLLLLDRWRHRPRAADRFVARDGVLMLIGFTAYALIRIVLEWVRVDESGQFGTSLSISQWVSIAVILLSAAALTRVPATRVDVG